MTVQAPPVTTRPAAKRADNYLTSGYGLRSWLLTVDHKRIGLMYLISLTASAR